VPCLKDVSFLRFIYLCFTIASGTIATCAPQSWSDSFNSGNLLFVQNSINKGAPLAHLCSLLQCESSFKPQERKVTEGHGCSSLKPS
jgi:hypothetical protein